jgi:pimeloyl-ACP methyl ester carboxylesterase
MADVDWELLEAGPVEARCTALLLPGALCSAASYEEVMAEPVLGGIRIVAVTLPGHAGAPPLDDCSIENNARVTAELARRIGADVVVGYSMGGSIAIEMVASGGFSGPLVLLGVSLSSQDEAATFRGLVHLGTVLGSLPSRVLAIGASSMIRRTALSVERKRELRDDFRKNVPKHTMPALREYVRWLHRQERPAERLCQAGVPTWVVHAAEKGDGGLTDDERTTLEACATTHVVTIPGTAFFLPNEASTRVAEVIVEAVGQTSTLG